MKPPSLVPLTDPDNLTIVDGVDVPVPEFCRAAINSRAQCREHYGAAIVQPEGYFQCPFGFTTRSFTLDSKRWFASGVIAHPRFGTKDESEMAKRYPASRVSRKTVEATVRLAGEIEKAKSDAVAKGSEVLPQAFHELRKLNGAVIQHAEKVISEMGESRSLLSIKSAAELMRNNFDILEALSNIHGMSSLPLDATVNLFDLSFKMKRIYQERASSRSISIHVSGVRAIVKGSQKSFPLVPAVLLENAIKYGVKGQGVVVHIEAVNGQALLYVENKSDHKIDPVRCFERGVRFAEDVEGGGFGLYLAKEIVMSHGGSIRCDAQPGVVTMVVELPLFTVIPQPN